MATENTNTETTTKPKTKKSTKKASDLPLRMQKQMEENKAKQASEEVAKQSSKEVTMSPEVEAYVNGADLVSNSSASKPKGKIGRPASLISKRKVTFDISEELIAQIDKCANYLGTTRAAFCAQAVMWKVREMQKTENLE